MSKVALVLEGGALRGIFTAGVVDCFLEHNIHFDYVVGVSAGACNLMSMVSRQPHFFKQVVLETGKQETFYGLREMAQSHKLLNLNKIFNEYTYTHGFDIKKVVDSKTKWDMVVTNIETGKAEYLHTKDEAKARIIGTASCSIPVLTDPVEIDGHMYSDGGSADSIPLQRAIDMGYDKFVVVCTRKKGNFSKTSDTAMPILKRKYKDYPNLIKTLEERGSRYKRQISMVEKYAKGKDLILIRPTMQEIGSLESDADELSLSYYHGYTKAEEYISDIKRLKRII